MLDFSLLSLFPQSSTPGHWMVPLMFKVYLLSSGKYLWKPSEAHPEVCLPFNSKSSQVHNEGEPAHPGGRLFHTGDVWLGTAPKRTPATLNHANQLPYLTVHGNEPSLELHALQRIQITENQQPVLTDWRSEMGQLRPFCLLLPAEGRRWLMSFFCRANCPELSFVSADLPCPGQDPPPAQRLGPWPIDYSENLAASGSGMKKAPHETMRKEDYALITPKPD